MWRATDRNLSVEMTQWRGVRGARGMFELLRPINAERHGDRAREHCVVDCLYGD